MYAFLVYFLISTYCFVTRPYAPRENPCGNTTLVNGSLFILPDNVTDALYDAVLDGIVVHSYNGTTGVEGIIFEKESDNDGGGAGRVKRQAGGNQTKPIFNVDIGEK